MVIAAQVPSGFVSPDGMGYDVKSKVDELLAAQAVVGDLDAAELGYLNGVTAGTSAGDKAVVLDAAGKIDALDVTALKINGTALAATAASIDAALMAGTTTVPANTLAIPVTHRFVNKASDAGGDACTLADGVHGQIITIFFGTDGGGDAVITPATKTGFTSIALADAGDQATLQFITTLGWVIMGVSGLTAPPVINA